MKILFNLMLLLLVWCQETIIWLRVSLITQIIVEEYIFQDFCQIQPFVFSIQINRTTDILIYENEQLYQTIQIQDKIGEWIEIILNQEKDLLINGKHFQLGNETNAQIQFIQIERNFKNFFIQILKDDKYNNFLLKDFQQQYLKTITFDTFISDQDAIITFWFKFMVDYETRSYLYFQSKRNQLLLAQIMLVIELEQIQIDEYEKKYIYINGKQWNQIQIILLQDQIEIRLFKRNQQVKCKIKNQGIRDTVNKELIFEQEGLYVGHLSIQYQFKQYYCSPGCKTCQNQICLECYEDQYLVDNQCNCIKFYQSQNVAGQCQSIIFKNIKVLYDLYQNYLLTSDEAQTDDCKFGYLTVTNRKLEQSFCVRCPYVLDQVCDYCLENKEADSEGILQCRIYNNQIYFIFEYDQFVITKNYTYNEKKQVLPEKKVQILNNTQLIIVNDDKKKSTSLLLNQNQYKCTYNCECQYYNQINYCMNIIVSQDYYNQKNGFQLLKGKTSNTFKLEIIVFNIENNVFYLADKLYQHKLQAILNEIDIDSIFLIGIKKIEIVIDLQIQINFDQILLEIEQEMEHFSYQVKGKSFRHYNNKIYSEIHLTIKSNNEHAIGQDFALFLMNFEHITLENITFQSNLVSIDFRGISTTLKNIKFNNNRQINISMEGQSLSILNVFFYNLYMYQNSLINIRGSNNTFQGITISNCTFINGLFIGINANDMKLIYVDKFLIEHSKFIQYNLMLVKMSFEFETIINCENIILNHTTLQSSYFLINQMILEISIQRFLLANSIIIGRLFEKFITNQINYLIVTNCTFQNISVLFEIYQLRYLRIRNVLLFKLNVTSPINFFIINNEFDILISFVFIDSIIINEGAIFQLIGPLSAKFNFILVKNSSLAKIFTNYNCKLVQIQFLIITESLLTTLFIIYSSRIQIQMIKLDDIKNFSILFQLGSVYSFLKYIIFSNFSFDLPLNDMKYVEAFGTNKGNLLMYRIKYVNIQQLHNENNVQYIKIMRYYSVRLDQVTFSKNLIHLENTQNPYQENQGLIVVQSNILVIRNIFVNDLQICSKNFLLYVFIFQVKEELIIEKSTFESISLFNCILFHCQAIETNFMNNQFFKVYIENYGGFIFSYNLLLYRQLLSEITSDDTFILLRGQNLIILSSSLRSMASKNDLIEFSDELNQIIIKEVLINDIFSPFSIYLLKQISISKNLVRLRFNSLQIINTQLGLADLNYCGHISIVKSQFIEILNDLTFLRSNQTIQFTLESSTFNKIVCIYYPLIKLENECKIIKIRESQIKNLQFKIQSSLIEVSNNNKSYLLNNYFFNNTCIKGNNNFCYLIDIIQDYDMKFIYFQDNFLQFNNITKIINHFSISQKVILRQGKVFSLNLQQQGNLWVNFIFWQGKIMYYYYEDKFENEQIFIKLNINNYYLVESLVNIKNKLNNKVVNISNNPQDQVVYLPSGQILKQYKILDGLNYKQYITEFVFELTDLNEVDCSLNLIELQDNNIYIIQSYSIQINQDLSHILKLKMNPYNKQSKYSLELICHDEKIRQIIQYRIKPLPCQKGEYYSRYECNKCNIEQWFNTLQKNQNKCDYFDQKIVIEMKQGLIKIKSGYWRPYYHDKEFSLCESSKCLGGWQVGDSSCNQGSSGALCQECDIYNKRGNGSYSKLQDQLCVPCSTENNYLIINVFIIFCYQLIQTYLACNKSQRYISNYKIQIQQQKQFKILSGLQIDQISIYFKMLQDVFIKLILFNKLTVILPDIISVSLNLIPTELVNKGLYCNIYHLGPNILILELICIFAFTLFLIQLCIVMYMFFVTNKKIVHSITYITTVFQYGYKQSYIYISQLYKLFQYIRLLTQLIYVAISNEYYVIGNQQYQYKYYKHITFKFILPIYLIYSILIPIIIIIILKTQSQRNDHKFYKLWAFYIQNYNQHFQFWDLYLLLQYSILQFIYYFFYQQKSNQFTFFCVAIFLDLVLQKHIKVYNLNILNLVQYDTQMKILALQTLLYFYYQMQNEYISLSLFGLILVFVYNIVKTITLNVLKRIILQYVHFTISFQDSIIKRFPKFVFIQKKFNFDQNPARAKFNFQKLVRLVRKQNSESSRNQPIFQHKPPNNSLFTEQSQEIELIDFQKHVQH